MCVKYRWLTFPLFDINMIFFIGKIFIFMKNKSPSNDTTI
jgi:hypothetical protein